MKKNKNIFGFTLIEIMVVVSSVGLIMVVVVGSLLQIMKVQNQNEAITKLSNNGNWILLELKRNLFNSDEGGAVCGSGNSSVEYVSLSDKLTTVISCGGNKIASTSGSIEKKLNADDVSVTSCTNFAVCNNGAVTFSFGIGTSVAGVGVTRNFTTTVTLRNVRSL